MKHRILITDDDRSLLCAYRALLGRSADFTVDLAQSPEQAHELMDQFDYDAACFDIELSAEETGLDLLSDLKRAHPKTPVLMMSSRDDEGTVGRCLALGAQGFASKNRNFLPSLAHRVHGLVHPCGSRSPRAC
jgi:DNA-binding NarL/FixJ family response regulator